MDDHRENHVRVALLVDEVRELLQQLRHHLHQLLHLELRLHHVRDGDDGGVE